MRSHGGEGGVDVSRLTAAASGAQAILCVAKIDLALRTQGHASEPMDLLGQLDPETRIVAAVVANHSCLRSIRVEPLPESLHFEPWSDRIADALCSLSEAETSTTDGLF